MKTTNIDNTIREKLQNRTLRPSDSAWDRLEVQLDEQSKKAKKSWVFYSNIAAGFLLLVSLSVNFILSNEEEIEPTQKIVNQPIDTINTTKKIDVKIEENKPKTLFVEQTEFKKTIPKSTNTKKVQKDQIVEQLTADNLVFD
jgi:antitoxin component YwqK of YwqJK toxin-antitoxin module